MVRVGSSVYWKVAAVKTVGLPLAFVRVLMVKGATPSALSNMAAGGGNMKSSGKPSAEVSAGGAGKHRRCPQSSNPQSQP